MWGGKRAWKEGREGTYGWVAVIVALLGGVALGWVVLLLLVALGGVLLLLVGHFRDGLRCAYVLWRCGFGVCEKFGDLEGVEKEGRERKDL